MGVANIPNLVRSHPTFAPPNGGAFIVAEEGEDPAAPQFWVYFSVAFTLVVLGGVFAGLTLGYEPPFRLARLQGEALTV